MSAKRGGTGKREEKKDEKVEAEAQALIEKQDTTDVDGAFLRGLLVDITNERDVEINKITDEMDPVYRAISKTREEYQILLLDYESEQDATKKAKIKREMDDKDKLARKLMEKREEAIERMTQKNDEYNKKQREIFYISPLEKIDIKLNVSKSMSGTTEDTLIKPQREFLESIWNLKGGKKEYEIKVEKRGGGGGTSYPGEKRVTLGTKNMAPTTPLHEFAHQVEEQTPGLRKKRAEKTKEIILKYTGKQKLEDVELEKHVWYIDSQGKEHYHKVGGKHVYVPKGIFKTREEQSRYGYDFRVYENDVQGLVKKRIKPNVSEKFGVELVSTGVEHLYNEPAVFAKRFPEIFDMVVDITRGKI
jgi:hypothetical protein